ncbi:hypothetical protein RTCIAT899_CH12210 [Rhizobium tropici CIAT 899]|nr:hypothetical protein RTCIAT899_CH12210 [Rhizobium tropici CIAT 899]
MSTAFDFSAPVRKIAEISRCGLCWSFAPPLMGDKRTVSANFASTAETTESRTL